MPPKACIKPKVQLIRHLKSILSTAQPFIPISKLKTLKAFFRNDKNVVKLGYDFLLSQLHQDNSRIRFTTFTIIEYLFSRCKYFRDLLIVDLNEIIQLTTGILSHSTSPSPLIYARKLRSRTLRVLNHWNQLYGLHYPSLSVSSKFLKQKHKDNNDSNRQMALSELPMNSEDFLNRLVPDKAIKIIQRDLNDTTNDIEELISKCNSCFELLIPKLKDFYFRKVCESENSNLLSCSNYSTNDSSYEEQLSVIDKSTLFVKKPNELSTQSFNHKAIFDIPHRYSEQSTLDSHSLNIISPISKNSDDECEIFQNDNNAMHIYHDQVYNGFEMEFKLDASIVKIQLSPDNQCIIANLYCFLKLLTIRYLPRMLEWLQTIGKTKKTDLLVSLICFKNKICGIISKAQHIEIYDSELKCISPLLNYFVEKDNETIDTEFQHFKNVKFTDPTSFFAQISSKSVSKLDRKITIQDPDVNLPTLYHGADFYLKNSRETVHSLPVYEGLHTFWVAESEKGKPSDAAIALLDNRLITCTKMFRPIEMACGFPLANGKLCVRRDKYICPFHGQIIPRNLEGTIISPSTSSSQNAMEIEGTCNDMELLAENIPGLKAMFQSVRMRDKYKINYPKANKMPKYVRPKLKNTARSKLEKKLLDASTSIKVSNLINSRMHEKNKSKFIYNFNYALHS